MSKTFKFGPFRKVGVIIKCGPFQKVGRIWRLGPVTYRPGSLTIGRLTIHVMITEKVVK